MMLSRAEIISEKSQYGALVKYKTEKLGGEKILSLGHKESHMD